MKGTCKEVAVNVLGWQLCAMLRWPCRMGPPRSGVQLSRQHDDGRGRMGRS